MQIWQWNCCGRRNGVGLVGLNQKEFKRERSGEDAADDVKKTAPGTSFQ